MSEEVWTKEIDVDGVVFQAILIRRPFREGLEVRIELPSGTISVAELGLGEQALLEKATQLVRAELLRTAQGSR